MPKPIRFSVEMPEQLAQFRLPVSVQARLDELLDRQDRGLTLNVSERGEAEGLVDVAEFLSLLRLRAERVAGAA